MIYSQIWSIFQQLEPNSTDFWVDNNFFQLSVVSSFYSWKCIEIQYSQIWIFLWFHKFLRWLNVKFDRFLTDFRVDSNIFYSKINIKSNSSTENVNVKLTS